MRSYKNTQQCKEFLPTKGVGNKIKSCKKILLIILYEYVFNDLMQYLRWRQSSVKLGKLLHSFLLREVFFFRYELSNNSSLYSHKKFYVISLRRFKFFVALYKAYSRKS